MGQGIKILSELRRLLIELWTHSVPLPTPFLSCTDTLPPPDLFLISSQICPFLKNGATEVWEAAQDVPYAYKGNEWLGYDNTKSFQIKVE